MKVQFLLWVLVGVFLLAGCQPKPEQSSERTEPTDTTSSAPADTVEEDPGPLYGFDISHYQGSVIDNLESRKDDISFIICKATEGGTYLDPKFQTNWLEIKNRGFVRGAYHFFRSESDPKMQASQFINAIGSLSYNDFPPIVDVEEASVNAHMPVEKSQAALLEMLDYLEQSFGRKPMIYTNLQTGNSFLNRPEFEAYPLWMADYSGASEPRLPSTWEEKGWILWQRSESYRFDHLEMDFDVFQGGKASLKRFLLDGSL